MSQYLEFISNHPFLTASAAALLGLIVAFELRNATRGYHSVDAADAPRLINHDDAVVLDVRPRDDYKKGRIINAVSMPADTVADQDLAKYADSPLIVYDENGTASARVAAQLVRGGCKRVYQLNGGLAAWQSAGMPLAK